MGGLFVSGHIGTEKSPKIIRILRRQTWRIIHGLLSMDETNMEWISIFSFHFGEKAVFWVQAGLGCWKRVESIMIIINEKRNKTQ
jgi:hypothetical protein